MEEEFEDVEEVIEALNIFGELNYEQQAQIAAAETETLRLTAAMTPIDQTGRFELRFNREIFGIETLFDKKKSRRL